jgi:DNA repair exonuclease SbcCD ATPase subunit
MFVNFIDIKFRNVLSYGSDLTHLKFENGLILISGKNGSGKSSFLDALSFCLFGKPYRKIKMKELINRTNKKKLFTECNFKILDDQYIITRTLKPDSLTIKKKWSGYRTSIF